MNAQDWRGARIRHSLYKQIEYAVEHITERGQPKYKSVSDFATRACIQLLDKEKVKLEAVC